MYEDAALRLCVSPRGFSSTNGKGASKCHLREKNIFASLLCNVLK